MADVNAEDPLEPPDQLTVPAALQLAIRHHREGRLDIAEAIYRRVLDAVPDHPDALHFLGVLLHRRGHSDDAVALIRRAIAQVPGFADFHVNLGNILVECGRLDEAVTEYEEARRLRPDSAEAWNNLGSMYRHHDRIDDAEAAYRKAIELDPELLGAHNNLGMIYWLRKDFARSVECFCKAIGVNPAEPDGHRLLGMTYYTQGRIEEAAEVFRKWLAMDPDNPAARHYYAACSGRAVPERASDDYVAYTFDRFATSFEEKLQAKLHYRAPSLLAQALEARLAPPARQYEVLDAGCGTGLCGPLIAPWARRLTGVDLSAGMLAQAHGKHCYDTLEKAELGAWLADHADAYDLVLSADTLCYFGALDAVTAAAFTALRPGGVLAYTVERFADAAPGETFRLAPSGRYQHTEAHVRATLAQAGFVAATVDPAHLRAEGGRPVEGLVVVAARPPG